MDERVRPPRSSERGKKDLVLRLRSMIWFASVDNRYLGNSVRAMDADLLGLEDLGARVMWRIGRHASDPGKSGVAALEGRTAVEVIGERSGFFHTKEIYSSELFSEVLAPTPLSVSRRDELIGIVLDRLGLYELTKCDRHIASKSTDFSASLSSPRYDLSSWLRIFVRKRNINHVLLLCLLYLRALSRSNLREAIVLRDHIRDAINRFCGRPGFRSDIGTLWQFITWRRVFSGRSSLEHGEASLDAADQWVTKRYLQVEKPAHRARYEFMRYIMACILEMSGDEISTHIMNRTAVIDEFLQRRDTLEMKASRSDLAHALWNSRRSSRAGVTPLIRFGEMRGHSEPWRPGDY